MDGAVHGTCEDRAGPSGGRSWKVSFGLLLAFSAWTPALRADHIPTAQEGLGSTWWGVILLGVVAMTFMGGIGLTVIRIVRDEAMQDPDGPDGSNNGSSPIHAHGEFR